MSRVIRFKDLLEMLDPIDMIKIGNKPLFLEDEQQLAITNPLVHIEKIKFGSSCGEDYPYGIYDTTYYITIL